jgi:hypothetical protein
MSKRSAIDLLRDRNKKQKKTPASSTAKPRAPPKPKTPVDKKFATFDQRLKDADAETTFTTAMDYGRLMVKCFWMEFATFNPFEDVSIVLQREEPSFSEGVARFLKEKKVVASSRTKLVQKEVAVYRAARREELHKQQREALRSQPSNPVALPPIQRSTSAPVLSVVKEIEKNTPMAVMPPERSAIGKERDSFYASGELCVGENFSQAFYAVDGVVNKLTSGEVIFASGPTPTSDKGSVGSYRHDRHGGWAHAGPGSHWAEVFVPSLDRIAQRKIAVGARAPLFFPVPTLAEGMEQLSVVKIGEGKYSEVFAPSNMLASDKPVDMTDWPPMLVRKDKNGVCRPRNVVIRVPRLSKDDRAINDGSLAYAHREATNLCEAAVAGFGPSIISAFFLPDPDPPCLEEPPRHAFRFVIIMKRQSASLEQRIRTSAMTGPNTPLPQSPSSSRPAGLPNATARYLTMLFDTVFEYSARGIVFLDSTRGNFMDEETAFRSTVKPEELHMVNCVNVIDLDPRFYRRLDGAPPESVWLLNVALVLCHMRRADFRRNFIPQLMQMSMHGGMSLGDLIKKVHAEQKQNTRSAWLFSVPWNSIPSQWKPDFDSEWQTSITAEIQQIVGYYFFYSERDGNGRKLLEAFDSARCGRNQQSSEAARSRFYAGYVNSGGMYTVRHFLLATKDKTVESMICALLMYVDAATLLKRPELLRNEPYAQPTPLPRMGEPLGSIDSYLGLCLRSVRKLR